MGRNPNLPKSFLLALALATATLASCDFQPKVLGAKGKLDFSSFDTSANAFRFNFAFVSTTRANDVYVQGAANSKSGLISTCNLAGTGCQCQLVSASTGDVVETTTSSNISYDEHGNYFRCRFTTSPSSTNHKVRMSSISGTNSSENLSIETSSSLTLGKLLGNDLDQNRVRGVYRYQCEYSFLQKQGTTSQTFDCSNAATACDTGNFCLLKAKFPFYLYADTYSTNFFTKMSDKLYAGGGGDNKICGLQIKQIDCVGPSTDSAGNPVTPYGNPVKKFGLYSQLTGSWETAVQLPAGPDQAATTMGYAAKVSSITGECPPGLEKKIFYTVSVVTSDITPDHNFTNNQIATEIESVSTTPSAFRIKKFGQGSCNGTSCVLPISEVVAGAKPDQSYSSSGQTAFCVIPSTLVP